MHDTHKLMSCHVISCLIFTTLWSGPKSFLSITLMSLYMTVLLLPSSSSLSLVLSWKIDSCSFKGSRDAGLNQRRTRYICSFYVTSHFDTLVMFSLQNDEKNWNWQVLLVSVDWHWFYLNLTEIDDFLAFFLSFFIFSYFLRWIFFVRAQNHSNLLVFCEYGKLLCLVHRDSSLPIMWIRKKHSSAASVQCVMVKRPNVTVCHTMDRDSPTGNRNKLPFFL